MAPGQAPVIRAHDANEHRLDAVKRAFDVNNHRLDVNKRAFDVNNHRLDANTHYLDDANGVLVDAVDASWNRVRDPGHETPTSIA